MDSSKPFRTTRQIMNLRQGRNDWYSIKNVASGPTQVNIYDEIGFFGVTAQDFIRDLDAIDGDVELYLSSPGGEVFDGLDIYAALQRREGTVSVTVGSIAASIASVIAMAASPGHLKMSKNATMMIHDGFGMGIGNAADMRQLADLLDKTSDNIASVYADRTGKPAEEWRAAMKAETWYSAQEAVDAGLADSIIGANTSVSNTWDLSVFRNAPGSTPEPVNAAVDNSPWDADKAWHNGAASDDPAAFYAGICAGKKDGDKATQAAWALPYKYHPGDAPNAAGVRAGLARLNQTEGLTNEAEAKSTLESAMKKINPDYEASDASAADIWAEVTPDLFAL